jgi:hypothetical protein
MSDTDQAVDKTAEFVKTLVAGWPVYGVVAAVLWGYGEFWLDAKIADAIKTQTLEQPAIVGVTQAVQTNTNAINRVETKVEEVEGDTKAILLHLAGED